MLLSPYVCHSLSPKYAPPSPLTCSFLLNYFSIQNSSSSTFSDKNSIPTAPTYGSEFFYQLSPEGRKKKNESFSTIMTTREHSNTFWWTKPFLDKTNNLENRIQCAILKSIKGSFILALLFCPAVVSFISKIFIYITGDVKFLMILLLHL